VAHQFFLPDEEHSTNEGKKRSPDGNYWSSPNQNRQGLQMRLLALFLPTSNSDASSGPDAVVSGAKFLLKNLCNYRFWAGQTPPQF